MTTKRNVTLWDLLSMSMWSIFFGIGLIPEIVFHGLRALANVSTRSAMVNSSAIITMALCLYIAIFVMRQCRTNGLSVGDVQAKGIHAGLLSLLAFIEIPGQSAVFGTQTLLGLMLQSSLQVDQTLKVMLWVVGCTKLAAWLYLYTLMIRFHVLGNRAVFAQMPTFFVHVPDKHPAHPKRSEGDEVSVPTDSKSM